MVGSPYRPCKIKVGNNRFPQGPARLLVSSNSDTLVQKFFVLLPLPGISRTLDKNMPGLLSHVPVIGDQPGRGKRGKKTVNYQP